MKRLACLALPLAALLATPTPASTAQGPGRPSISIADASVVEGDVAVITLTLSAPASGFILGEYRLGGRSAKAGLDFIESSGFVIFSPGDTQAQILVQTMDDTLVEGDEVFAVHFHASGVSTGGGPARVTIVDAN